MYRQNALLPKKKSQDTGWNRAGIGRGVDHFNIFVLPQNLYSFPKPLEEKIFSAFSYSIDLQISDFFLLLQSSIKTGSNQRDLISFFQ